MKYFKAATMALGLTLLGAALTATAFADESNKKTTITFSGPAEIPGVHLKGWGILPAGTYVFKVMDSQSDRHIVQIFNQDETVVYATILAIPNYRLKTTDKTVITFRERPAGEPEALRAWFYPGDNYGQEFVYGKEKAVELARTENAPVLFAQVETVEVMEPIQSMDHAAVLQMKAAPVMAVQPTGDLVALNEIVEPLPARVEMAKTLPATGSNSPLIALLGLICLGGAAGIGAFARRSV